MIYTWKPDLPDFRDYAYSAYFSTTGVLPRSVDLRLRCSTILDQGSLGSCTGMASVSLVEYVHKNYLNDTTRYSPLFIYYNERVIENTTTFDSGASIRDSIRSIYSFGVCPEVDWPYFTKHYSIKPNDHAYVAGSSRKIASYYRISSILELKNSINDGYPVIFGITVYSSFESSVVMRTGIVPLPTKKDTMLGGHAIMAVGYDDASNVIICRNSWGTSFGMAGYFTLPYTYITNTNLADDFWTIRK